MKSIKPVAAASTEGTPGNEFKVGQVWKIGEMNLAVTMVGKVLVHYKRYKTHPRGTRTTLSSKANFESYLLKSNATLVTE